MIKNLLAVAIVLALSACSGGSDDPVPDAGTVAPPAGTPPVSTPNAPVVNAPTGGGSPPASDTKAGTYIGDFGSGTGVYVINNDNFLSGLALSTDGSASSVFGDVGTESAFTGELRTHFHDPSVTPDQGIFGAGREDEPATTAFDLNIVNGQTIESLSGPSVALAGVAAGELSPATVATLAGSWTGQHRFCGADVVNCSFLVTSITINGTTVTGQTSVINPEGEEVFINEIAGGITEFGDVSLVSFTWLNNTYDGVAFFVPGATGELVFIGETLGEVDNRTIASLLSRS